MKTWNVWKDGSRQTLVITVPFRTVMYGMLNPTSPLSTPRLED